MATIGNNNPTLLDFAKRQDPDGKIDTIVEMLSEENAILEDMSFVEGNLETGHRTTVRSGMPTATWRKLNYGVQPDKSTTVQVTDSCGMLEAYAEVDKKLADLNGNTSAFRLSEDVAFLESMNQTMADTVFTGDVDVYPERFMGLGPRYDSLSAENGGNIIAGGGSGSDNHSIWLVVWSPTTCHGIFPKGSKAGFSHEDLGEVTLDDAAGGHYQGYRTHYQWDIGLTVKDWRYIVRIANIDNSALTNNAASGANLRELMVKAVHKIPNLSRGRAVFYANRTIETFLDLQTLNANNGAYSYSEIMGKKVLSFRGIPIKRCDALLDGTEATIS